MPVINSLLQSALGKALEALAGYIYIWLVDMLNLVGIWWLEIKPIGDGEESVVRVISDVTRPLAAMVGTVGLIVAFVRVGRSAGAKEDTSMLIEGLMRVAIAGSVAIPGTQLLMAFSSQFSPWIFRGIVKISGHEGATMISTLPQGTEIATTGFIAIALYNVAPFVLFASLIQLMMAMGTDIAASLLSGLLPITAAASVTAQGNRAFWKQVGWIISCVMFKPAAAIIYGFGVALTLGGNLSSFEGTSNPALSIIAGLMTIILACFSLPALVALVSPMSGVLGSSGGRFLSSAASAAVGAAIVMAAGAATGGAGAAPAAAATGASGAAGGAAGGTAAGASTATAGTSAASSAGAGAEAAGGASAEPTASGAQASAEGSGAAGSTTAGAGETTGASELGADEASATGDTPGVDADATDSNLGAGDAAAAGADSYSANGAPASNTTAPDSSTTEPAGTQSGANTDAPDTGASAQMPASGDEPDTSSSSNASGAASSTSSSTGATSAETSGTSTGSDTSSSSGASLSSSYSDGSSSSAPAAANGAPTTTNNTYRPRGGTAAHDAARYLQDMTRAIGDETEGAIRPEGAGQ
ncbi:hypothetical protein IR144_03760 [Rothia nasimurium]|nr:hypothetical protein [Rothia nasimurium]